MLGTIRAFWRDQRGVAMLFAAIMVPFSSACRFWPSI